MTDVLSMPCLWQTAWSYKWSTICGCVCWTWLHLGRTGLLSKAGLYHQGCASKSPKATRILPLSASEGPPASCRLGLVTEKASGRIKRMEVMGLWWGSGAVQSIGKMQLLTQNQWVCLGSCPDFGSTEPLVFRWIGLSGAQRLSLLEARRVFLSISYEGGSTSQVQGKVGRITPPHNNLLIPPPQSARIVTPPPQAMPVAPPVRQQKFLWMKQEKFLRAGCEEFLRVG